MADKNPGELYEEFDALYVQDFDSKTKIEVNKLIAKANKQVVDSINELVSEEQPDAKFRVTGIILGSRTLRQGDKFKGGLKIYKCEETGEKAYDCPECNAIVKGEFLINPPLDRGKTGLNISRGNDFYCRVCGTHLGKNYWNKD